MNHASSVKLASGSLEDLEGWARLRAICFNLESAVDGSGCAWGLLGRLSVAGSSVSTWRCALLEHGG